MISTLLPLLIAASFATLPTVDVVYPRSASPDSIVYLSRVDENFIFGSVSPPDSRLFINGMQIYHHRNGAFLSFLPVDWKAQSYDIFAVHEAETTYVTLPFEVRPSGSPPVAPETDYPVQVMLGGRVARTHPRGAYFVFPDQNTNWIATDWLAGYYQLPLTAARSVWISEDYVTSLNPLISWRPAVLWQIEITDDVDWELIHLPLGQQTLFRIFQETETRTLKLELYGVISHLDLIHVPGSDGIVREIVWDQPADHTVLLTIGLDQPLWGYRTSWDDQGNLTLAVRKPPALRSGLKGLRILIDAGHGGANTGAIGPRRTLEKEINLLVALELEQLLRKKGAEVLLTRVDDRDVGLSDRIQKAVEMHIDLALSIHHNALPDGTNPFGKYGTSTHYYHPHSRSFAASIQNAVVNKLELPNEGLYYHNLAFSRIHSAPSILLEAAYVMFPEQEERITQNEYPQQLAQSIYRGLRRFLDQEARNQ